MVMSWIYTGFLLLSVLCAVLLGRGSELSAGIFEGAAAGVQLALSMAGSICLWSGVGKLLQQCGAMAAISRLLRPVLRRLYPSSIRDNKLADSLSSNICANLLGLGNAATPMGIQAARQLAGGSDTASDELCRLVVMNTASIQLIPSTVAALRASLGSSTPLDILLPVWCTSLLSVTAGLAAAKLFSGRWRHG